MPDGDQQAARRMPHGGGGLTQSEWGWVWPADRRMLYNRASADPDGKPWSERKKYMWWDEDRPLGRAGRARLPRRPGSARSARPGRWAARRRWPATIRSSCRPTARAGCSRPTGLVDGPLPAHYEPQESPVRNALYPQQQAPARVLFPREDNMDAPSAGSPGADVYPFVFTTYRLTEHHTAGGMSRWSPYLAELQPEMFCEISPELAAERGLENGGWATIISPRAAIEARVLVTDRVKTLTINGREVQQVGLPYHWGSGTDAVVDGRRRQRPDRGHARPEHPDPGVQGRLLRRHRRAPPTRRGAAASGAEYQERAGDDRDRQRADHRSERETIDPDVEQDDPDNEGYTRLDARDAVPPGGGSMGQLAGPTDPIADAHWHTHHHRKGFFTDTSICIGCKACEVACKEWNRNPRDGDLELTGMSYDNTQALGASTWRHVAFIEQDAGADRRRPGASGQALVDLGMPTIGRAAAGGWRTPSTSTAGRHRHPGHPGVPLADGLGRLQALHPRRLPGRVPDRCAVPHRVRHRRGPGGRLQRLRHLRRRMSVRRDRATQRRHGRADDRRGRAQGRAARRPKRGVAQKCTLCYDRLLDDETPACAKTCPTTSIKFGDHDDMVDQARERVAELHAQGHDRGAAVRRQRARRRRRHRVGVPAAGRAGGVRPAAGPAGAAPLT